MATRQLRPTACLQDRGIAAAGTVADFIVKAMPVPEDRPDTHD